MSEFLYVEPRRRGDLPFYVRVLDPDEHHPKVDGKRAAFAVCDAKGDDLNLWMSESKLRKESRKISRAILAETSAPVLVPV